MASGGPGGYSSYGGNPYSGGYESGNPYGNTQNLSADQPPIAHQTSNYSQASAYSQPGLSHPNTGAAGGAPPMPHAATGPAVLSNQDFLARVEAARRDIDQLSSNVSQIAQLHQRAISSPDTSSTAALENLVSQTQIHNTRIRDQVKFLEADAARSGGAVAKDSQIRSLKNTFKARLEQYQEEERQYRKRYQEQIARQYRIVNPEATEEEVQEAATANWGDEGVFQTALKSNRTGAATSVLGAVRARHAEIQQIEKTLLELNQLFTDLAEAVVIQEPAVAAAEEQTSNVVKDTEQANTQLNKGVEHARRARRLKWIMFWIVVLVILILALVLGLVFGLRK